MKSLAGIKSKGRFLSPPMRANLVCALNQQSSLQLGEEVGAIAGVSGILASLNK